MIVSLDIQRHNQSGIIIIRNNKDHKGASLSLFLPRTRHYDYNYRYRLGCESMQALRSLLYEGNGYAKAKVVVFAKTALQ